MTAFGRGTFKQQVYEFILEEGPPAGFNLLEAASETLEVVAYVLMTAHKTPGVIKDIYEQAKQDAKQELLAQIQKTVMPKE